jgi:hypothetical protein
VDEVAVGKCGKREHLPLHLLELLVHNLIDPYLGIDQVAVELVA